LDSFCSNFGEEFEREILLFFVAFADLLLPFFEAVFCKSLVLFFAIEKLQKFTLCLVYLANR